MRNHYLVFILVVGLGAALDVAPTLGGEEEKETAVVETDDDLEYRKGAFVWRPSRIRLSLPDDNAAGRGEYLRLDQALTDGEYGWKMKILDLPDTWQLTGLRFDGLAIRFENQHDEAFRIEPPKLSMLTFEILDGGRKTTEALEDLWRKHASVSSEAQRPMPRSSP